MSNSIVENSLKLNNLAMKILKIKPKNKLKNFDELFKLMYEENYGRLPVKIDSKIDIDIANENDCAENLCSINDLWIFGYGSLVWKADFPFLSRHIGCIKGFRRFFYQNSIDHRGTPEFPGRVVTLVKSNDPDTYVWGTAYRISADNRDEVLKHLDFREKNGYQRLSVIFYPYSVSDDARQEDGREIFIYIADETNDSYAGHINQLEKIAEQIYFAVGPSGENREYVYKLANAMRLLFPGKTDEHLFALEALLKEMERKELIKYENFKELLMQQIALNDDGNLEKLTENMRKIINDFKI